MLSRFSIYKSFVGRNSSEAEIAHKIYLKYKKRYNKILASTKRDFEGFIKAAPNAFRVAWQVVSQDTAINKAAEIRVEPDLSNTQYVNSVTELVNKI